MKDLRKEFEQHITEAPGRLLRWLESDLWQSSAEANGETGGDSTDKGQLIFAAAEPFTAKEESEELDIPGNRQVTFRTDVSGYADLIELLKDCTAGMEENGRILLCAHNAASRQRWYPDWSRFVRIHVFGGASPVAEGGVCAADIVCTREELKTAASSAGLRVRKIYYPFPDWYETSEIYTDGWFDLEGTGSKRNPDEAIAYIALLERADHAGRSGSSSASVNAESGSSDSPENLLYLKISEQRAAGYRIDTRITRLADGTLRVNKYGPFPEDEEHADNVAKLYEGLTEQYRDTPLHVNKVWKAQDRGIDLEYVTGETLEKQILGALSWGREKEAEQRIDEYFQLLAPEHLRREFTCTPDFLWYFGLKPQTEEQTIPLSDIDVGFDNAIPDEEGLQLLDYEWTFDFPIPVRYLYYRVLYYFENKHPEYYNFAEELMNKYGISGLAKRQFYLMEEFFQKKVGCPPDSFLTVCREMEMYSMTREFSYSRWEREKYQPLEYCNDGLGWSEDQKEPVWYVNITEGTVDVHTAYLFFPKKEAEYAFRMAKLPGLLTVFSLTDQDGNEVPYRATGKKVGDGRYFNDSDMPLLIPERKEETQYLCLRWTYDGLAHATEEDLLETEAAVRRETLREERAIYITQAITAGQQAEERVRELEQRLAEAEAEAAAARQEADMLRQEDLRYKAREFSGKVRARLSRHF